MILFLVVLVLFMLSKKRGTTIMTMLSGLYLTSLFAALLLSPSQFFLSDFTVVNYLYLIIFFSLFFLPWADCSVKKPVVLHCTTKDYSYYKIMKLLGIFCFVFNIGVYILLASIVTDYSSFKNGDDGEFILTQLPMGARLVAYISQYSSLLILALPYHFFFLQRGENKGAIWALIVASNFVLSGLVSFSRSRMVMFFLIYSILFIYFRRSFIKKLTRRMRLLLLSFVVVVIGVFFSITSNRFGGDNIGVSERFMYPDALVSHPVLNSQLSYFSQWYNQSNIWLPSYQGDITNGSRTFPLVALVLSRVGLTQSYPDYLETKLEQQFGNETGSFLGCVTVYLYDYGYIFTIILALLYFIILKNKLKVQNLDIVDFMLVIIFLQLPCSGIFNSAMNRTDWHFELLLFLLFKLLSTKVTYKIKSVN